MEDVVPLLFPAHIGIGSLARLARVSRAMRDRCVRDPQLWQSASGLLGWKRLTKSPTRVVHAMCTTRRCRECGSRDPRRTGTVWVCTACSNVEGGYSQLVHKWQIERLVLDLVREQNAWKVSTDRVVRALRIARVSAPYGRRLYWASNVRARLASLTTRIERDT